MCDDSGQELNAGEMWCDGVRGYCLETNGGRPTETNESCWKPAGH
jgi:hypothetical protein